MSESTDRDDGWEPWMADLADAIEGRGADPAAPEGDLSPLPGSLRIVHERCRQIEVEGYTVVADVNRQRDGELAIAAWCSTTS